MKIRINIYVMVFCKTKYDNMSIGAFCGLFLIFSKNCYCLKMKKYCKSMPNK